MLFSLEVLQAKHGDCLILHYGDKASPQFIVIDGGPSGVYSNHLNPRLKSLKNKFSPDEALPISLVMVSHMDDDHVNGILKLVDEIRTEVEDEAEPPYKINNIWFNAFDDIIGNKQIPISLPESASAADLSFIPNFSQYDHHKTAVLASTGQGRKLKKESAFLFIPINHGKSLMYGKPDNTIPLGGLKIQVILPNLERLQKMQKKWDKDLEKAKEMGDNTVFFSSVVGNRDTSAFNLASIVCLIEMNGKTILLTGDARGDDIMKSLKSSNLLTDNVLKVDILKIPHHGSERNVSVEFFQMVVAKHYIISGDGRHHNPDKKTLDMIEVATRGVTDDFTIHFTNKNGKKNLGQKINDFINEKTHLGRSFKVNFLDPDNSIMQIDLLEGFDY